MLPLAGVLFVGVVVAAIVGVGRSRTNAGGSSSPPSHAPSLKSSASFDVEMLSRMNTIRHQAGLAPLRLDHAMSRLAEGHSQAAARRGKLFNMPAKYRKRYASGREGYREVEIGFLREGVPLPSAQEVVDYMMKVRKGRRTGRRAILSPVDNLVGIGVATRPTHLYATAFFSTGR